MPKHATLRFLRLMVLFAVLFTNASAADAESPAGQWSGGWSSQSSGHSGTLRARIRPIDSDTYRALFAGRFAKVVPFVYPAKLHRVPGSSSQFTSSTRLPFLGTYRMNATVSPNRFHATFRGKKDSGVFDMTR